MSEQAASAFAGHSTMMASKYYATTILDEEYDRVSTLTHTRTKQGQNPGHQDVLLGVSAANLADRVVRRSALTASESHSQCASGAGGN